MDASVSPNIEDSYNPLILAIPFCSPYMMNNIALRGREVFYSLWEMIHTRTCYETFNGPLSTLIKVRLGNFTYFMVPQVGPDSCLPALAKTTQLRENMKGIPKGPSTQ